MYLGTQAMAQSRSMSSWHDVRTRWARHKLRTTGETTRPLASLGPPGTKQLTKEFVDVISIDENGIMTIETHDGSVNGPLLVSEKINLQRGSDADGRLARAKDEGILLRR